MQRLRLLVRDAGSARRTRRRTRRRARAAARHSPAAPIDRSPGEWVDCAAARPFSRRRPPADILVTTRAASAARRSRSPRPPPCSVRPVSRHRSRRWRAERGRAADSRRSAPRARSRPPGSASASSSTPLATQIGAAVPLLVAQRHRVVGRVRDRRRSPCGTAAIMRLRTRWARIWRSFALISGLPSCSFMLLLQLLLRHALALHPGEAGET